MRLAALVLMVIAANAVAHHSDAQEMPACFPSQEESEMRADIFALLPETPVAREDSVNFRITGKVRQVTDGDTVTLTGKRNARFVIRLSDFDAPETSHEPFTPRDCKCAPVPFRPGQAGGKEATEALRGLLSVGDDVTAECYELDDYGRSVCHVFKGRMNVNLEMIRMGWGRLPDRREWVRDEASAAVEREAKSAGLGAWSIGRLTPSAWRQQCWRHGQCDGAVNWPNLP